MMLREIRLAASIIGVCVLASVAIVATYVNQRKTSAGVEPLLIIVALIVVLIAGVEFAAARRTGEEPVDDNPSTVEFTFRGSFGQVAVVAVIALYSFWLSSYLPPEVRDQVSHIIR